MTQSVLLTAGAGLLGMVFAAWGVDLIHSMVPPVTARYITGWDHVGIDGRVLAFSTGAVVLIALVVKREG